VQISFHVDISVYLDIFIVCYFMNEILICYIFAVIFKSLSQK
jgi:hypothetical protein